MINPYEIDIYLPNLNLAFEFNGVYWHCDLYKNKKWLKVSNQELYNFAVWVAQSPANLKNAVVMGIEDFLKK